MDSTSGISTASLKMSAADTAQQVQMAMLSKGKDMIEQNGQSVMQLINSASQPAPQPVGSLGNNLNVYA
ncbi:putative motility protein [Ectothiorhodospiraceae bacterium BW-2]|nr:putative motility protein [Ectothiorhodospiraceae bacterium BW-2]